MGQRILESSWTLVLNLAGVATRSLELSSSSARNPRIGTRLPRESHFTVYIHIPLYIPLVTKTQFDRKQVVDILREHRDSTFGQSLATSFPGISSHRTVHQLIARSSSIQLHSDAARDDETRELSSPEDKAQSKRSKRVYIFYFSIITS